MERQKHRLGSDFRKCRGGRYRGYSVNALAERIDDADTWFRRISDRYFGGGSARLPLMLPAKRAGFRIRMFSAGGSAAGRCGYAFRCVGQYAHGCGSTGRPLTGHDFRALFTWYSGSRFTDVRATTGVQASVLHSRR